MYLLQAFLGPIESVHADWRSLGGDPNLAFDEWRAQVRCRDGLGQFQLSWNVKPMQSQIIIQGTKGVLRVDDLRLEHDAEDESFLVVRLEDRDRHSELDGHLVGEMPAPQANENRLGLMMAGITGQAAE